MAESLAKQWTGYCQRESEISYEKKLPKIWENKASFETLFSVIDESRFWTSGDIVLPIKVIIGLTEERVLQQRNNFRKKVNKGLKKFLAWLKLIWHVFCMKDKLIILILEIGVVNFISL